MRAAPQMSTPFNVSYRFPLRPAPSLPLTVTICLLLALAAPLAAARLPQTVIPSHYAITITPDLTDDTFKGEETIDVDVRERVESITMHALLLRIGDAKVTQNGKTIATTSTPNRDDETITLKLAEPLAAGPASIRIVFDGRLNKQLRGLYLSKTAKRKYAVTQFEATDARRAFPSFDEPAMKATFDITLVVDKDDTAISNASIASDTPLAHSKHAIKFATTARMSTYLVAMFVGDFRCTTGGADGIPIRVCTTPGREKFVAFALAAAEKSIAFYDSYYGIKYPFKKLDLIGLPDFEAGAMENAGAVTFRESALLVDDKNASPEQRRRVAETVAHEIAHMWFGDLVTMKWWDDIWLNEGFATFMSDKPLEAWKPEWHLELGAARSGRGAVSLDAQRSTRAIRTDAETSAAINSLFDGIAYGKTAAVLRMVEHWVGEEAFRDGIREYLHKYSFGNAAAEDLWSTLTETTKRPVDQVMRSFVTQAGAPLLRATESCQNDQRRVEVAQERLLMSGDSTEQIWAIPVCGRVLGSSDERCAIVDKKSQTLTNSGCASPLLLNARGRGYFVVDYSPQQRSAIRARIGDLTGEERIQLHGDEWLLVRANRREVGDYLSFVEAQPHPASSQLVQAIAGDLSFIDQRLVSDANRAKWQAAVRAIIRNHAEPSWALAKTESEDELVRRAAVLRTLGYIGNDPAVIAEARELAQKTLKGSESVNPLLASTALEIASASGNAAMFDQLLTAVEASSTPERRNRYLGRLSEFRDPALVARAIDYVFSSHIRSQDMPWMLSSLLSNPAARAATWTAVKQRWPEITEKIPTALHSVIGALGSFCDPAMRRDVEEFFKAHEVGEGMRSLRRTLESIDTCVAFKAAQQESLDHWLDSHRGTD